MEAENIHEALMQAIEQHHLSAVQQCLESGANPNYTRHTDAEEPDGYLQPTTPLRLVMFCASDSLLTDDDLGQLAEIARLLLRWGADPKPAMEIAEYRYGEYNPEWNSPFMEVWHVVAQAAQS